MKFPKGFLNEKDGENARERVLADGVVPKTEPAANPETEGPRASAASSFAEKDRLFQTVEESQRNGRKYLAVLLVVCVVVAAAASAAWFAMRPGIGDRITAPQGLELALRDHFLEKENRVATDVAFYMCEGTFWARVGVETRTDMPNPLFRVGTYAATATEIAGGWSVSAKPAAAPEALVPCS